LAAARSDPLPLFERDRELAKARAGRLLIVEGDPGAGKSSLLDHAATEAGSQSMSVRMARISISRDGGVCIYEAH
jgi:ribose 1,5-bisphosphokinase PhnN